MAVDLSELIDSLKREVSPPGTDLYPGATDDSFIGSLTDAFWEIRLYGLLSGFEENVAARGGPSEFGEGIVTPTGAESGYDAPNGYLDGVDLSRDLQQLIVLWSGWKIVLTQMQSLTSSFRAKAGAVEFETQRSATTLKAILDQLKQRVDFVLYNLSQNAHTGVAVLDAVIERTYAEMSGEVWWVG